ncbi:MAG: hypothetical protein ACKVOU_08145 [Cytophagales bacterium]
MAIATASQGLQAPTIEVWKEVPLPSGYSYRLVVSTLGNAKTFTENIDDGQIIKPIIEKARIFLNLLKNVPSKNGKLERSSRKYSLHLLIAKTFIPNPYNLKFIKHKDGNVQNNAVDNLEWQKFRLTGIKLPAGGAAVKIQSTEKVKVFFVDTKGDRQFAITSFGRVILFHKEPSDGRFIVPYIDTNKREMITIMPVGEKRKSYLVHKLVAVHFLPPPRPDQIYVTHLDKNVLNNYFLNLQWSTQLEKTARAKEARDLLNSQEVVAKQKGQKLTVTQVILIKRLIKRGKMRNKMIAKQFGISEMAIYRIKRGENWAHISIDNK